MSEKQNVSAESKGASKIWSTTSDQNHTQYNDRHAAPSWIRRIGVTQELYFNTQLGAAIHADSLKVMQNMADESVDLVITSPPFPLLTPKEYGNVDAERYIDWLMPFIREICRVLKPTGSLVLDLGGSWQRGRPVRTTYQFELVIRVSKLMFLAQDFYWHDPTRLPVGAWVISKRVRVKDSVNTVWWFSKTPNPKADNRRVLQPYSKAMRHSIDRSQRKGAPGKQVRESGHRILSSMYKDNGGAIPSNLLSISNSETNSKYRARCRARGIKTHPARFPEGLVDFFVKFLTDPGDLVLDPFAGSVTVGTVCEKLNRRWLAVETVESYLVGGALRFSVGKHV